MSHCYIALKTAKINRQPRGLEIVVSNRKQSPRPRFNRQQSRISENQFRHANSSHSPLTTSHCLFHQQAQITASGIACTSHRLVASFSKRRNLSSLVTHHSSLPSSRRTCQGAKKQQIRRSLHVSLGLYFLASYAQFPIGRQRALVHNGGNKVAAGCKEIVQPSPSGNGAQS